MGEDRCVLAESDQTGQQQIFLQGWLQLLRISNLILKGLYLESYVKNFMVGGGGKKTFSLKNNFVYVKTTNYCEGVVYKISVLHK